MRDAFSIFLHANIEHVPFSAAHYGNLLVKVVVVAGQDASCDREEPVAVADTHRHPTPIAGSILREAASSRLQQKEKHRPDIITPAGPTSTSASPAAFHRTPHMYNLLRTRPGIRENDASN